MHFSNTIQYRRNRAYVKVELWASKLHTSSRVNLDVLVDTGADYLVLPDAAAAAVGLDPSSGAIVSATGVAGSVTLRRLRKCHVVVEGLYDVDVDILFGTTVFPVLGMDALLSAMETGFEASYWHYE